jgi:hypothetical protein
MHGIRKEVLEYISMCERIHGLIARDGGLTLDECELIALCQRDLGGKIDEKGSLPTREHLRRQRLG